MDDVKERIEELVMTCISDSYDLKAGSVDRQREVQNVINLTELLSKKETENKKFELEETKLKIESDRLDETYAKNRDELTLRQKELENSKKDSKLKFAGEIARTILVGVAIPVAMMIDEHSGDLLNGRVFKFWSRPKI